MFKCNVELSTAKVSAAKASRDTGALYVGPIFDPNEDQLSCENAKLARSDCVISIVYSCAHRSIKDSEEAVRLVSRCLGNEWKQSSDQASFSRGRTHVAVGNARVLLRRVLPAPTGLDPVGERQVFLSTWTEPDLPQVKN